MRQALNTHFHRSGFEHWPLTRRELDPHYDRVEAMLMPQPYPFAHEPYSRTPKTLAFKWAAEQLDLEWNLPNLAVTFGNRGESPRIGHPVKEDAPNMFGAARQTCRLCGECDIGCNFGSKNTLDLTYLSAAQRLGADIRTLSEVRSFAPRDHPHGGYLVSYVWHQPSLSRIGEQVNTRALPPQTLTCDHLILAAGTFGTGFLLLKNRGAFPRLSKRLGEQFSGNGDLLTFAVKAKQRRGEAVSPWAIEPGHGPVITSTVHVRDEFDGAEGRGFYLQDGGYPDSLSWILQALETPQSLWQARSVIAGLVSNRLCGRPDTNISTEIARVFGQARLSAGVLPLLGMGRDIPDGRMVLRNGMLDVDWRKDKSGPYFDRVRETMRKIATVLGASFVDTPTWRFNRLVTAHPLGGCPMGHDAEHGVVDPFGNVFGYPGLHIADGSVMPGPVGPNPSLTIAALADRFAEAMIDQERVER